MNISLFYVQNTSITLLTFKTDRRVLMTNTFIRIYITSVKILSSILKYKCRSVVKLEFNLNTRECRGPETHYRRTEATPGLFDMA